MINQNHSDFFIILGYLASQKRNTKLDIETSINSAPRVEAKYRALTGIQLTKANKNYYEWKLGTNKWGSELRIYYKSNVNIPTALSADSVEPRFSPGDYNARINNNTFVWLLIEYGFMASDGQNVVGIQSKVPQTKLQEFNNGLNL